MCHVVLGDEGWVNDIGRYQVIEVNSPGITDGKGPVSNRKSEWPPDTSNMSVTIIKEEREGSNKGKVKMVAYVII